MPSRFTCRDLLARQLRGGLPALALALVAACAGVALLGVSGWFLTGAAMTTAALSFNLFGPSALVRGLSFLRIGARYGEKLAGHDAMLKTLAETRERVFRRLIPRVPLHGMGLRHGDLVSRMVGDVEAMDAVLITALGPAVTMLAVGVGLTAILAWWLPAAAMVFGIGFALAGLLIPALLLFATRRSGRAMVEHQGHLRMAVLDGVEGHGDLLAFGHAGTAAAEVDRLTRVRAAVSGRQAMAGAGAAAAVMLVAGLTSIAVLLMGLDAVLGGRIGGPLLIGFTLAVLASFETALAVVRGTEKLGMALAAMDRLRRVATAAPAVSDPTRPDLLPEGGDLVFDHVCFGHRPDRMLLKDVSLDCPPGSRTAIVGDSGSGKSTLLDLALRLLDPDDGTVLVAGRDVAAVAQADLHRRVALMSQSSPVFLGTIRDNLRLACPHADDATLWDALARARLDAFVRALPEGLETWCGESGRTLSGGEARRLCLARTLLTPATILLFDEPTAGLDRDMERAFLADLAKATAGRTVLLVTHARLPPGTVDRVFRLAGGRLSRVDQADQPATASSALLSTITT